MLFEALDFTFDVTGLNEAIPDLKHFDKDSDYYAELVSLTNTGVAIAIAAATIYVGWGSGVMDAIGAKAATVVGATAVEVGGMASVAYGIGSTAYGFVEANAELERKKEDLKDKQAKLTAKQLAETRRKMLTQSIDTEYIMEGYEQMVLNNYAGMTSGEKVDIFDPSGFIPMDTRYRPSAEVAYGYEDAFTMFDESTFVPNMLYGKF